MDAVKSVATDWSGTNKQHNEEIPIDVSRMYIARMVNGCSSEERDPWPDDALWNGHKSIEFRLVESFEEVVWGIPTHIHPHTPTLTLYIHMYVYVCAFVCMCVCMCYIMQTKNKKSSNLFVDRIKWIS